jgi:ABC-type bacteriocin/lantibiotic exporter with double-glycine peptidase domain
MIQVTNLTKKYIAGVNVLNISNLEIPKGQSFGLVGNNGAGKTTFFSLLLLFICAFLMFHVAFIIHHAPFIFSFFQFFIFFIFDFQF